MKQQDTYFYVHFLGGSKSGKTSIINQLLGRKRKSDYKPTERLDPLHEKIENHNIYYYDTPGSVELINEIQFLQLSNIIVLVYDVSDDESINYLLNNAIELVQADATGECKIAVCANKKDLRESSNHSDLRFKLNIAVGKLLNTVNEFQVSCETGQGIEQFHKFLKKEGTNNGWSCCNDQNIQKDQISQISDSFISRDSFVKKEKNSALKRQSSQFLKKSFSKKGIQNVPLPNQQGWQVIKEEKGKQSGTIQASNNQSNILKIQNIDQVHNKTQSTQQKKELSKPEHYHSNIGQQDPRRIEPDMRNTKKSQTKINQQKTFCGVGFCQIM